MPDAGPDTGADSGEFDAADVHTEPPPGVADASADIALQDAASDAGVEATVDGGTDAQEFADGAHDVEAGNDASDKSDGSDATATTDADAGAGPSFPEPLYDCDFATPSVRRSVQLPWNPANPTKLYGLAMHRTQTGQVYIVTGGHADPVLAYQLDLTQPGSVLTPVSLSLDGTVLASGPITGGLGVLVDSVVGNRRLELVPIREQGIGTGVVLSGTIATDHMRDWTFRETAPNEFAVLGTYDPMPSGGSTLLVAGRYLDNTPTLLPTVSSTSNGSPDYQPIPGGILLSQTHIQMFTRLDVDDGSDVLVSFRGPASGINGPGDVTSEVLPASPIHALALGHAPFAVHTLTLADFRDVARPGLAFLSLLPAHTAPIDISAATGHWLIRDFGGFPASTPIFAVRGNKEHNVIVGRPPMGGTYLNLLWVSTDGTLYGRRAGDPTASGAGLGLQVGSSVEKSVVSVVFSGGAEESISVGWITTTNVLEYDTIRCVEK